MRTKPVPPTRKGDGVDNDDENSVHMLQLRGLLSGGSENAVPTLNEICDDVVSSGDGTSDDDEGEEKRHARRENGPNRHHHTLSDTMENGFLSTTSNVNKSTAVSWSSSALPTSDGAPTTESHHEPPACVQAILGLQQLHGELDAQCVLQALDFMHLDRHLAALAPRDVIVEAAAGYYLSNNRGAASANTPAGITVNSGDPTPLGRRQSISNHGRRGSNLAIMMTRRDSYRSANTTTSLPPAPPPSSSVTAPLVSTFTSEHYKIAAEQTRFRRSLKFVMDLSRRTERTRQREVRIAEHERQRNLEAAAQVDNEETYRKLVVWTSFLAALSFEKLFRKKADLIEGNKVIDQLLSPLLKRFIYRYRARKKLVYCLAMVLVAPSHTSASSNVLLPASTVTSDNFLFSLTRDPVATPGATIDVRSYLTEVSLKDQQPTTKQCSSAAATTPTKTKRTLKAPLPKEALVAKDEVSKPTSDSSKKHRSPRSKLSNRHDGAVLTLSSIINVVNQFPPVNSVTLPLYENAFEAPALPGGALRPLQQFQDQWSSGGAVPYLVGIATSIKDARPPGVLSVQSPSGSSDTTVVIQPVPGSTAAFAAAVSGTAAQASVVHNPTLDPQVVFGRSLPTCFLSSAAMFKPNPRGNTTVSGCGLTSIPSLPDIRPQPPLSRRAEDSVALVGRPVAAVSRQPLHMPSAPLFSKWTASHVSGLLALSKPKYYHAGSFIFYADKAAYNSGLPEPTCRSMDEPAPLSATSPTNGTGTGVRFTEPVTGIPMEHNGKVNGRTAVGGNLSDDEEPNATDSVKATSLKRGLSFTHHARTRTDSTISGGPRGSVHTWRDGDEAADPMAALIDIREREQRSTCLVPSHAAGAWCDPTASRQRVGNAGNRNSSAVHTGNLSSSEDEGCDGGIQELTIEAQPSQTTGFSQFRPTAKKGNNNQQARRGDRASAPSHKNDAKQYLRHQLGYDIKSALGALSSEFVGHKHGSCNLHAVVIVACGTVCEFAPLSKKQRSALRDQRRRERRLKRQTREDSSSVTSSEQGADAVVEVAYFTRGDVIGATQAILDSPFYKNVRCETDCIVYEIPAADFIRFVYGANTSLAMADLLGSVITDPAPAVGGKVPKPPTTTAPIPATMTGHMKAISARVKTLMTSAPTGPQVGLPTASSAPTVLSAQCRRDAIQAARALVRKHMMNKESPQYLAPIQSQPSWTTLPTSYHNVGTLLFRNSHPVFGSWPPDALTLLLEHSTRLCARPGETLVRDLYSTPNLWLVTLGDCVLTTTPQEVIYDTVHRMMASTSLTSDREGGGRREGAGMSIEGSGEVGMRVKRAINGRMYGMETILPWDTLFMKNKPFLAGTSSWDGRKPRAKKAQQRATYQTLETRVEVDESSLMAPRLSTSITTTVSKSIIKSSGVDSTTTKGGSSKPVVVLDVPGSTNPQISSGTLDASVSSVLRHRSSSLAPKRHQRHSVHNLDDDSVLTSGNSPIAMVAATYCEAYLITRADFMHVLRTFFVAAPKVHNYNQPTATGGLAEFESAFGREPAAPDQSSQSLLAHMKSISRHQLTHYPAHSGISVDGRLGVTPESLKASVRCFNLLPPSVLAQVSKQMEIRIILPGEYLLRSYATIARSQQLHFVAPSTSAQVAAANAKLAATEASQQQLAGGVQSLCTDAYVLLYGTLIRLPLVTTGGPTHPSPAMPKQFEELYPLSFHCFEECLTNHAVPYELYAPNACVVAKVSKESILEAVISDHQRRERRKRAHKKGRHSAARSSRVRSNSRSGDESAFAEGSLSASRSRRASVDSTFESDLEESTRTSIVCSDDEDITNADVRAGSSAARNARVTSSRSGGRRGSEEAPLIFQILQKAESVVEERYGDFFKARYGDGTSSSVAGGLTGGGITAIATTKFLRGDDDVRGLTKKQIQAKLEPTTIKEANLHNDLTERGSAPEPNELLMARVKCAERALDYKKKHGGGVAGAAQVVGPDGRPLDIHSGASGHQTLEGRIREQHFRTVQIELHKLGVENKVLVSLSAQLASATAFFSQDNDGGGSMASGFAGANQDEGRDAAKLEWLRSDPGLQDASGGVLRGPVMYAGDDGDDVEFTRQEDPLPSLGVEASARLALPPIPHSSTTFLTGVSNAEGTFPIHEGEAGRSRGGEEVDWTVLKPLGEAAKRIAARTNPPCSVTSHLGSENASVSASSEVAIPKIPEVQRVISLSNAARGGGDDEHTSWHQYKRRHANTESDAPPGSDVQPMDSVEGIDAMLSQLTASVRSSKSNRAKADSRLLASLSPRFNAPAFQSSELHRQLEVMHINNMRAGLSSKVPTAATVGVEDKVGITSVPARLAVAPPVVSDSSRIRDIGRRMDAFVASADRVSVMMTGRLAEIDRGQRRREIIASSARQASEGMRMVRTARQPPTSPVSAAPAQRKGGEGPLGSGLLSLEPSRSSSSIGLTTREATQIAAATLRRREALHKRLYSSN